MVFGVFKITIQEYSRLLFESTQCQCNYTCNHNLSLSMLEGRCGDTEDSGSVGNRSV